VVTVITITAISYCGYRISFMGYCRSDISLLDSKRFWRWCITHRITEFLDFFRRAVFQRIENTTFQKLDLFLSSGEGGGEKTPTHLGPLERTNLNHWTIRFTQLFNHLRPG
jgi:hypothetical protein